MQSEVVNPLNAIITNEKWKIIILKNKQYSPPQNANL